jgi:hypothetical protein
MKRLKDSTLQRYSALQLAKHLAQLNHPHYWLDLSYDQVLILDQADNGIGQWLFHFTICEQNKDYLIELHNTIHNLKFA